MSSLRGRGGTSLACSLGGNGGSSRCEEERRTGATCLGFAIPGMGTGPRGLDAVVTEA